MPQETSVVGCSFLDDESIFKATLLWEKIVTHLEKNIKCGRHTQSLRSYANCFQGSKAVDCLLSYLNTVLPKTVKRHQVQTLCQKLVHTGVIEDVKDREKGVFREGRLFRLTKNHFWTDTGTERKLPRARSAEEIFTEKESDVDDLKGYASDSTVGAERSRSLSPKKKKRQENHHLKEYKVSRNPGMVRMKSTSSLLNRSDSMRSSLLFEPREFLDVKCKQKVSPQSAPHNAPSRSEVMRFRRGSVDSGSAEMAGLSLQNTSKPPEIQHLRRGSMETPRIPVLSLQSTSKVPENERLRRPAETPVLSLQSTSKAENECLRRPVETSRMAGLSLQMETPRMAGLPSKRKAPEILHLRRRGSTLETPRMSSKQGASSKAPPRPEAMVHLRRISMDSGPTMAPNRPEVVLHLRRGTMDSGGSTKVSSGLSFCKPPIHTGRVRYRDHESRHLGWKKEKGHLSYSLKGKTPAVAPAVEKLVTQTKKLSRSYSLSSAGDNYDRTRYNTSPEKDIFLRTMKMLPSGNKWIAYGFL